MPDLLRRARDIADEEGPRALAMRSLGELGLRRLALLHYPLEPLAPPPGAQGLSPTLLDAPTALDEFLGDHDAQEHPVLAMAARAVGLGHRAVGVRDESGRLVSASFFTTGIAAVPYLGAYVRPLPGYVYAYGAFTRPELRRAGISALRMAFLVDCLLEEGHRGLLALVLPENQEGSGFLLNAGYVREGRVLSAGFGPLRRVWVDGRRDLLEARRG
jgi:GNAT superfamily N-acetyltransferase